jgi:hypothetical protein
MQNQTTIPEPALRRLAHDFDALADVLHTLIDRGNLPAPRHDAFSGPETEFTTEWQMVSGEEERPHD